MLSIIFVAICSTEGNGIKSLPREEYAVTESEFETVTSSCVQGECETYKEFVFTKVLITSFNGVSASTTSIEIISLVKAERLTTGGGSVGANMLCTLFDEPFFNARYSMFGTLGAFNRSICSCVSFDDVRFCFSIVGSLDLGKSRFEFSFGLDVARDGRRQLSLAWAELLCGKFQQGSSIG